MITGCVNYKPTIEEKKVRKEKAIVLGSMVTYAIGMKIIADKQTIIK